MLFISILLSVWFVLWLVHFVFIRDVGKAFLCFLMDLYGWKEEEDEDSDDSAQQEY